MKRFFCFLIVLLSGSVFAVGPNVLNNTDHIVTDITAAIAILGGAGITVDQTCGTGTTTPRSNNVLCGDSGSFIANTTVINQSVDTLTDQFAANSNTSTGTPNSHVPYKVMNQSSTGYNLNAYDLGVYSSLITNDQTYVMAYCGGPSAGDAAPPVAAVTILPDNNTLGPLSSNTCGYATGIEFSMTLGYKGFATGTPSGTTEAMSAVMAVLRSNHPTWTWGDIKGALRQTSANWATGYIPNNGLSGMGYGNIDYDAANAIASTNNIFLQPPNMSATLTSGRLFGLTIYPFRQTRRLNEKVYLVPSAYVWPIKNEYTQTDINNSGANLLYISNPAAVVDTASVGSNVAPGNYKLVAFTYDGVNGYSRVESFSSTPVIIANNPCL